MNIHQLVATAVELAMVGGILASVSYVTLAAGEAKVSYDRAMVALVNGPPAPALEVTDEFIKEFVANQGKIEDAMREKYGVGFSD